MRRSQPPQNPSTLHRRDLLKLVALGGAALPISRLHAQPEKPSTPTAATSPVRGIIFMVSDGMSPGVLTLADAFSRRTRVHGTTWAELLRNPAAAHGLMDTSSASSLVTDSAAASTAWSSGQRVENGAINYSVENKPLTPIGQKVAESGGLLGLVTTATVTHATPAGFAASVPKRSSENDIAIQYLNRAHVILGGGSGYFSPKYRPDKRDLAGQFTTAGYHVHSTRDELLASASERLLGTYTLGHLPYSIDRDHSPELAKTVPTLTEMADAALKRFLPSGKKFLLQIEGARIDHAAHLNDIAGLLHDQLAFDDTVSHVLKAVANHPDILVVVTSDHGNANPGLNGTGDAYCRTDHHFDRISKVTSSFEAIFNRWVNAKDKSEGKLHDLIQQHLGYAMNPEETKALLGIIHQEPITEWNHQLEKPEGILGQIVGNHFSIGWTGTSHTIDPTIVTAIGPQAQRFNGLIKNTDVHRHLSELLL